MDKMICPKCGTQNEPSSAFCGQCGTPLKTAVQSSPPPIPSGPPPLSQTPPPVPQKSFIPGQPPSLGQTSIMVQVSQFTGSLRTYKVVLDNIEIFGVKNGETKTFPIKPGNHNIFVKVPPLSSLTIPFSIAESECKFFRLVPNRAHETRTALLGPAIAIASAKPGEMMTLELVN
jgi:hypothetical protein